MAGAVARAARAVIRLLPGKGQEAARRDDPAAADDDGAVVERRGGLEERDQQVGSEGGVQLQTGVDIALEADLSLPHHDRAHPTAGEVDGSFPPAW